MGCCTSGNAVSTHRIIVTFGGNQQSYQNVSTLGALRVAITKGFPELKEPFALTTHEGTALTEDSYPRLYGQTAELKVVAKALEPVKFQDAGWNALAQATFKICTKGGRHLGTGFLLSQQFALTSASVIKGVTIKDLTGHFDTAESLDFPFDPQFVVNVGAAGVDDGLTLLKLTQRLSTKPTVRVTAEVHLTEGEAVTLIYVTPMQYSAKSTVLSAAEDGTIQKFDPVRMIFSKTLEEGAVGSPVFNKRKDLVGIYAGGNPGVVVNAAWAAKTMLSLIPSLGDAEKSAINEVLPLARSAEPGSESPSPPAPRPVERINPVALLDSDEIELASEHSKSDPLFAFTLHFDRDVVALFDSNGYFLRSVNLEHRFIMGASCVLTAEGLVITGPGPDTLAGHNAVVLKDNSIKELANMLFDHKYHTSVYFRDEVVAISGTVVASVERLPQLTGSWSTAAALPEKRAFAAAVVYEDNVYLIGGVAEEGGKPLTTILRGDLQKWTNFQVELPVALKGCGALLVPDKKKVVIFGGEGNQTVWDLQLEDGKIETKATFRFLGNMHCCQPVAFTRVMLLGSDAGVIYNYKVAQEKFQQLQTEASIGVQA